MSILIYSSEVVLKTAAKAPMKRMNVNLEATLHDRFKATAAAQGRQMTEILVEFIEGFLRDSEKPKRRQPR